MGKKGGGDVPEAPNPRETSAAQTSTNVGTAIANAFLGNVNQVTPDGTLSYDQTGTYRWYDPYTFKHYNIPTFTVTQTLSPEQQAIKDQTDAAKLNLATAGNNLSGNLQDTLSNPFSFDNTDAENWAYDLASQRILPQQQKDMEALRTRLLNSGIREGSAAWNDEMDRLVHADRDQLNRLALAGRQQAYGEARDQYTLPVNMTGALLSGGQVSNPNFVNPNTSQIPTTDVAGIINQSYQNELNAYQAQQAADQQAGAGIGSLFSGIGNLAGSFIGLSDERAKKDIEKIGEAEGMGLYRFRYKNEPETQPKHVGLMAQDVEKKKPSAVKTGKDGLKRVDYSKALGLMEVR